MLFSFFVLVCKGAEKTDSDNCDESACFIHTTYPLTLKSLSLDQMRTFGTYVIYKDIIFDNYCELHCFFDNVRNDYNEKKDNLVPLMMEEMFVYASRLLFMACGEQNRYKALDEELNEKFYEKLKSKDCWWKIFEKCKITMTQIRQIDELAKIYKTKKHILLRQVMFVVDSLYEILQEYPNDRLYIAQRLHDYMLREYARQTIVASGHDLRKLPCRFFVNSFGDKPVHDLETNNQTTLSMADTLNAKKHYKVCVSHKPFTTVRLWDVTKPRFIRSPKSIL